VLGGDDGLQPEASLQTILDLRFLALLAVSCSSAPESERDAAETALKRCLEGFTKRAKVNHEELLQKLESNMETLPNCIRSSRLLFSPLFDEPTPRDGVPSVDAPSIGSLDSSLNSTLRLVKPSGRIAMLHISN